MSELETAGTPSRLAAWIIDRVIIGSLWGLLVCWAVIVYVEGTRWPGDLRTLGALVGLLLLWGIGLHAAYFVVFVGGCGQTPGKMLVGIAVVQPDGSAVDYGRALLRWAGYGLAVLPLGLGVLVALFTAERRGLHDWIAGTRVVRHPVARDLVTEYALVAPG